MSSACTALKPLARVKSWNHITRIQKQPIAINIETKAPTKSWTDGKPQIGIWTDAWLRRCEILFQEWRDYDRSERVDKWPVIPILISQGHGWHLLIGTKTAEKLVYREQVLIGSTRNCFDVMKVVAVLRWLMHWAERVWRPWFRGLIAGEGS